MKNYYKILNVQKDASEEEIRRHWVELVRKLHPDRRIEGKGEDKRIKEINEAYQVLKHSSTRVQYDLKRACDQRKRKSSLRRLSLPIAILVVLVIIGALYPTKSQMNFQTNLPAQGRVNPIDQRDQTNPTNQINPTDPVNSIDPSTLSHIPAVTHQRIDASTHERIDASTPLIATEGEVKQFLANYVDRYNRKDLDGFFSLFSSKAVQNRKDGPERIKIIYAGYFDRAEEIQYQIEDPKIEIYQNGVEVKARYEINQTLKQGGEKKVSRGNIRFGLVKENEALRILSLEYQQH